MINVKYKINKITRIYMMSYIILLLNGINVK